MATVKPCRLIRSSDKNIFNEVAHLKSVRVDEGCDPSGTQRIARQRGIREKTLAGVGVCQRTLKRALFLLVTRSRSRPPDDGLLLPSGQMPPFSHESRQVGSIILPGIQKKKRQKTPPQKIPPNAIGQWGILNRVLVIGPTTLVRQPSGALFFKRSALPRGFFFSLFFPPIFHRASFRNTIAVACCRQALLREPPGRFLLSASQWPPPIPGPGSLRRRSIPIAKRVGCR